MLVQATQFENTGYVHVQDGEHPFEGLDKGIHGFLSVEIRGARERVEMP